MTTKSKRNKTLYGTVGMTPIVAMMVTSQPAYAVVLSNAASTINLCSGVSLQRSDLTSVLQPLANSVTTLEGSTNTLLKGLTTGTVGTLLGNLGITGPVSTNIGGTLAAAETGSISLQAVNANGQLITPSGDCYAQANGLSLTNQKGISIGGNGVTGLGDNTKATGNAGELNSISIGNDSATDATATNSLALGSQAKVLANATEAVAVGHNVSVSGANSTSIGSNSTVSAAGATAVGEAANVSAANSTALGVGANASVANSVALGQASLASRGALSSYTGFALTAPQTSVGEVSVGSASGQRQITNVAAGRDGTDAVNVSQLSAVNDRITGVGNQVVTNTTNINNLNNNLAITNNNLVTTNNNVTNLNNNITNGTIGIWRYSDGNGVPTGGSITNNITVIGGTNGPVYIHNVGNGVISASSNDAVNGSQLYNLQQTVNSGNTTINNQITNLTNQYNAEDNRVTNLGNVVTNNANTVTNLSNTVSNIDNRVTNNTSSINNLNSQVSTLNTEVAQNTSDITNNANNITNVNNRVTQVDNRVTDVDNRVTNVANSVTAVDTRVTNLDNLAVKYDATNHTQITLGGGAGGTKITNLANGDVSSTSTDAVNGAELYTVSQNANTAITNVTNNVNAIDARVTNNTNAINTTNNTVANIDARVTNNTNSINTINTNVAQNTTDITTNATNIANVDARETALDGLAVKYDANDHTRITLGGNGGSTLTNLKNGAVTATSSDAVNGSQLYTVQQSVTNATGDLGNQITNVDNRVTNVANNVSNIDARVTNNTTDISTLNTSVNNIDGRVTNNTNAITNIDGRVTQNTTDIANNTTAINNVDNRVTNVANNVSNIDARVTNNTTDISTLNSSVNNIDGRVTNNTNAITSIDGRVTQNTTDIANNTTAINNVDNRVTNVANNVSNIDTRVTNNSNDISTLNTSVNNIDSRVTGNTTSINNLTNQVTQNTSDITTNANNITNVDNRVSNVANSVTQVDNRVTAVDNRVTNISNDFDSFSSEVANGGIGPVQYSNGGVTPNGGTPSQDLTLVGGATGAVHLHNVADGQIAAGSTDAVNGGQIFALSNSIGSLSDLAVTYDDASKSAVTLGGAGSTTAVSLRNVGAGRLSSGSTDAVNGAQLYATNQSISDVTSSVGNIDNSITSINNSVTNIDNRVSQNTTDISNIDARVTNNTNNLNSVTSQVSQNTTNIANIDQRVTNNTNDISNVTNSVTNLDNRVTQNIADVNTRVTNIGSQVTQNTSDISNIDARVTNNSTNIANIGNQVTNIDNRVTQNTTDITNIGDRTTLLETGGAGPVQYSNGGTIPNGGIATQDLTLVGADGSQPVRIHNVADGVVAHGSTDAVNGGQLFDAVADGISDLAVTYDDANHTHVTLGGTGAPSVLLSNLKAGALTASSTDAVNGAQLYATNQAVSNVSNSLTNVNTSVSNIDNRVTNIDNRVTQNVADISAIDTRVTNNTNDITNVDNRVTTLNNQVTQNFANVGTQITNIDKRVTQNTNDISSVDARVTNNTTNIANIGSQVTNIDARVTQNTTDITNVGAQATLLADGGAGPVQYTNGGTIPNGGTPTNDLALVGADGTKPVALHNVADGVVAHGSTDAVNGGQLYDAVSSGVSDLAVVYDDPSHTQVSLGGTGAPAVLLTNLKAGTLSATSSDAVTGAQLYATNQSVSAVSTSVTNVTNLANTLNSAVSQNTTNITNLTGSFNTFASEVGNGGVGPVQYSDASNPAVSNGGTPSQDLTLVGANGGAVGLHNVAAGMLGLGSTDAVNGAQLAGLGVSVASKLGNGFVYNPTSNSFTGNFTYDGNSYGDVQSVIGAIEANQGSTTSINGVATTSKYFNANSVASNSVASGTDSTAVGPSSTSSGDKSVAMGSNANAQSDQSVAIGSGATAKDGMAVSIGMGNTASGNGAVAIGDPSSATGDGAIVLGKDDNATGTGAVALGNTNTSMGDGAAAIGNVNVANGQGAVSLGTNNSASGLGSIAIGSNNSVTGDSSLALGSGITTAATDTLAIGTRTSATAQGAVALGNRAAATGLDTAAVGTDTTASGLQSSAFGQHAEASADFTTAIGSQASATVIYGTAVGQMSMASGLASTALGTGAVSSGIGSAAIGTGAIASEDGSVALGSATQTDRGAVAAYYAFGVAGSQSSQGEIAIARNVSYIDPSGQATPTGNRQLTGLAAGSADTDAVNVAQLKGVSSTIGTSLASSLGGGATYNATTGQITGPSYVLGGVTFTSVGDAIEALARSTGTSTGTGTGTPIQVVDPNAVSYTDASHTAVAVGGATVSGVADGRVAAGSTDAVNGGQLAAVQTQVSTVQTQVSTLATQVSNGAVGTVQYANAATPTQANGGTKTNDVTLVGANASAAVGLHNVADGNVAAGSTDAVNGSQLAATNAHVATVETTANTAMAMSQNSAQYDDSTHTSMTMGNGTDAVGVHNVADGTSAHDAVNLGQLNSAAQGAVETANAYTDQQVRALSFDLGKVRKDSAAGVAGAMALAGMPQPYEAGRGMVSMGMGAFLGEQAIAVGIAKALSDEHTVVKMGATYNTRGQAGVNVGIGYQF